MFKDYSCVGMMGGCIEICKFAQLLTEHKIFKMKFRMLLPLAALSAMGTLYAQKQNNPIVQTCFTTDPAPMVYDGRFYLYTGHDEENADFLWMQEWRVYT